MIARLSALLFAFSAGAAHGADARAQAMPASVTVYPQGATVTREVAVRLDPGAHRLIVPNLPASVSPDSLRVEGRAEGRVGIGDVTLRQTNPEEAEPVQVLEAQIEALREAARKADASIEALEEQQRFVQSFGRPEVLLSRPVREGGTSEPAVVDWPQVWAAYGAAMSDVKLKLFEARETRRKLEEEIVELEPEIAEAIAAAGALEAVIALDARSPAEATIALSYDIPDAHWRPVYEAHLTLDGPAPSVRLVAQAEVMQASGEDWSDVALTLSTAAPSRGTQAPDLTAWLLRPAPPPFAAGSQARQKAGEAAGAAADLATEAPAAAPAPVYEPLERREAETVLAGFHALFKVPGRVSVPATDDAAQAAKVVTLGESRLLAAIRATTVPAVTPVAFLEASVTNSTGATLLPGPARLWRDGIYVGRGDLPVLAGGETAEIGFGEDPLLLVRYDTLAREEGENGLFTREGTETRRSRVELENLHDREMAVRVLDRLPVSESEDIVVTPATGSTPPDLRDVEGERGMVAWDLRMAPREKREIVHGFTVAWPADKYPVPPLAMAP